MPVVPASEDFKAKKRREEKGANRSESKSKSSTTMAPKRPLQDDAGGLPPKRQRAGFKVGPDNLPDGTWRRKGMNDY
jgi:hypothetical protein